MDTINQYAEIIEQLISEYAQFKPAYGEVETEIIFDREKGHYEMVHIGWYKDTRIHGCVIHIDLRDDKVWIQHDGTESGIALELVEAGIPKDKIILGFHPPDVRKYTEYAVA